MGPVLDLPQQQTQANTNTKTTVLNYKYLLKPSHGNRHGRDHWLRASNDNINPNMQLCLARGLDALGRHMPKSRASVRQHYTSELVCAVLANNRPAHHQYSRTRHRLTKKNMLWTIRNIAETSEQKATCKHTTATASCINKMQRAGRPKAQIARNSELPNG